MNSRRLPAELVLPALALLLVIGAGWWWGSPATSPADPPSSASGNSLVAGDIRLTLSRPNLWRLRLKREEALRKGVLMTTDEDQVRATLHEGAASWPVDVRLKGDWTDHLKGGKWSFRVRMRGGTAFRGMTVFSLQNPETRDFLSEWLFHRVLRQEGVLSPRYDFVRLSVNGSNLGVYALEEHFTKELLESQRRREGPLLKFNEDGLWEARVEALRDTSFPYFDVPLYEAAQAEAFQTSRYLNTDSARQILQAALNLMHAYKHALLPAGQIFDLDLVARQYALTDLFHGHHSLVWHNRRFAYNPIISRLEPVVYDAFAGEISGLYLNGPFTGYASNGNTSYGRREDLLGTCFFKEDRFVEAYYRYLWEWSAPDFLDQIKTSFAGEWKQREKFLRREFLGYRFDFGQIERNAEVIRQALNGFPGDSLKIYQAGENRICVQNYAPLPVELRRDSTAGTYLLGAWDGVAGAEWLEMDLGVGEKVWFQVAGAPKSLPARELMLPATPPR